MVEKKNFTTIVLSAYCLVTIALADDQPYIDSIKMQWEKKKEASSKEEPSQEEGPYIPFLMKDKKPVFINEEYIHKLQAEHPQIEKNPSYTEEEKKKLPILSDQSAIERFRQGRSELHPKFQGEPSCGFGLRYGVFDQGTIVSPQTSQNFSAIYGNNYTPNVSLFYEYQPIRNSFLGKWSLFGWLGAQYYHGYGRFSKSIFAPNGVAFPQVSNTLFRFYSFPLSLGIKYQWDFIKFLQPYVMAGGSSVIYGETRDDGMAGSYGHTEGVLLSGGAAFLLDWIYPSGLWNLYAEYGIRHFYLTFDLTNLRTFSKAVRYNTNTIYTGIIFEY